MVPNQPETPVSTEPYPAEDAPGFCVPVPVALLLALILGAIAFAAYGSQNLGLDNDEYQMLSVAFAVVDGEVLYRDVWDNHGPAITWLLAAAMRQVDLENPDYIKSFRWAAFGLLVVCGALLALWLRQWQAGRWRFTLLALLLLLLNPVYILKGLEIRADNLLTLVHLVTLCLWWLAWRRQQPWLWLLAGVAVGFGFMCSVKTLFLGAAFGCMFLLWGRRDGWRCIVLPMVLFGVGSTVGLAVMFAGLAQQGIVSEYLQLNFGENVDRARPQFWNGVDSMFAVSPTFAILHFGVLVYTGWQWYRRGIPFETALAFVPAVFLTLSYCFLLPTHNWQSLLTAIVFSAPVAAWAITDAGQLLGSARWPRLPAIPMPAAVAPALLVLVLAIDLVMREPEDGLYWQLVTEYQLQQAVPPGVAVLSGTGSPIARPMPGKIKNFVILLLRRMEADPAFYDPVRVIEDNDVQYLLVDRRFVGLGEETRALVADHYVPLRQSMLLAAGKVLPAGAEGGTQDVSIRVAGNYHWRVVDGADAELYIYGERAPNPVRMEDGTHQLEWTTGTLILSVASPEHWGNWREFMEDPRLPRRAAYNGWLQNQQIWPNRPGK